MLYIFVIKTKLDKSRCRMVDQLSTNSPTLKITIDNSSVLIIAGFYLRNFFNFGLAWITLNFSLMSAEGNLEAVLSEAMEATAPTSWPGGKRF